tara:strand:+ start:361 stop:1320 length:960 start_codon:yes stop_codon:yes gene_type:complete
MSNINTNENTINLINKALELEEVNSFYEDFKSKDNPLSKIDLTAKEEKTLFNYDKKNKTYHKEFLMKSISISSMFVKNNKDKEDFLIKNFSDNLDLLIANCTLQIHLDNNCKKKDGKTNNSLLDKVYIALGQRQPKSKELKKAKDRDLIHGNTRKAFRDIYFSFINPDLERILFKSKENEYSILEVFSELEIENSIDGLKDFISNKSISNEEYLMKLIRKNFFELDKIIKLEDNNSNDDNNEDEEDNNSNEDEEDNSLNLDELNSSKSFIEVYTVLHNLKIDNKPFDFTNFIEWIASKECQKLEDKLLNSESDLKKVSK